MLFKAAICTIISHFLWFIQLYNSAFQGSLGITNLIIPSVESIKEYCFSDCLNLNKIKLENCIEIKRGAFKNCLKLSKIDLPNIENIDAYSFSNTALTKIELNRLEVY